MSAPLAFLWVLTEHRDLDTMHRRAGRDARPKKDGPYGHGDCHKYCEGYSCGTRQRAGSPRNQRQTRSTKITAWRIAKARSNRAYLEEHVYGTQTELLGHDPGGFNTE